MVHVTYWLVLTIFKWQDRALISSFSVNPTSSASCHTVAFHKLEAHSAPPKIPGYGCPMPFRVHVLKYQVAPENRNFGRCRTRVNFSFSTKLSAPTHVTQAALEGIDLLSSRRRVEHYCTTRQAPASE
eukprot:g13977.t1